MKVRNLLTRRQDSARVVDDPADERVVGPGAARDERTTTRRMPPFLSRRPTTDETTTDRVVTDTRPATDEPDTVVERRRWAHVSAMATLSLILGVLAVAVTLTGLLAAEGVALGVIGAAVAAGGMIGASRRGVTGHSLAFLGLVASLAAVLLGVLAIGGQLSWLDHKTDEVARVHDWLLAQLPWLKRW
jgi:ElaB/YqjD/DUF883 family membrane-anchored ribosome-binding protein